MPKKFNTKQERQTYQVWADMRNRCNNTKHRRHADYGGRGIAVCERWTSFEKFLDDMGLKPERKCIGRKDINGPYSPDNCSWVTYTDNNKNQRRFQRKFTYRGESLTIKNWAIKKGIRRSTLSNRVYSYCWPIGLALEIPLGNRRGTIFAKHRDLVMRLIKECTEEGHQLEDVAKWFGASETLVYAVQAKLDISIWADKCPALMCMEE
jgi:hypothetical protein